MPRFPTRPACALLGLAACTPTAREPAARPGMVGRAPTAPPARVPAGWKVLATNHFSLAYPPDWTIQSLFAGQDLITGYFIETPAQQYRLDVQALPKADLSWYCRLTSPAAQTTLAGLPMWYRLRPSSSRRAARRGRAGIPAQDWGILATLRPHHATPPRFAKAATHR